MAGLAQSSNNNTIRVIKVKDKKDFIKNFNKNIPPKSFIKSCDDIAKQFGVNSEK